MSATSKTAWSSSELTDALIRERLWFPSGVPGVYGRSGAFEDVVTAFDAIVTGMAHADGAERVYFPPVVSRQALVTTEYMQSFPSLCGSIHSFCGDERAHRDLMSTVAEEGDWGAHLAQTALTLTPAACYPLYPTLSGTLAPGGGLFDLSSYVFRHEPSDDPARLQIFRMRENVRVGTADEVRAWRARWMERGVALLESLGLDVRLEVANDPFFGRAGRMLKANQRTDAGKFEIVSPICADQALTALASFNVHGDKFGHAFDIRSSDGGCAQSACFGFGLERVALALFRTHGLDLGRWPEDVRRQLALA
ncbi:MAG: amino acid--[acyl-carrier-protein] ligase [Pseudomonadales bacterium]